MDTHKLSSSLEDYLEAIYQLSRERSFVHANKIADQLSVGKSSVSWALNKLSEEGLINYTPYEAITLTPPGETLAQSLAQRHSRIKDFLTDVLAVEPDVAEENACRLEHVIDKDVLNRMGLFMDFLDNCPRLGTEWLKGFGFFCSHGGRTEDCRRCLQNCLEMAEAHWDDSDEVKPSDLAMPKVSKDRDEQTVDRLGAVLTESGREFTPTQRAIVTAFMANEQHQTPELLYQQLHDDWPSATLQVIDETLQMLCEHKIARVLRFQNKVVYEHLHPESHHDHLYCVKCGAIVEFYDPRLEALQLDNADRASFRPLRHTLHIYGVCQDCIRAEAHTRPLTECLTGERVCIAQIVTDKETQRRVSEMGLMAGQIMEVLSHDCGGGTMIVLVNGSRYMLDVDTAGRIKVQPVEHNVQEFMRHRRRRHRHRPDHIFGRGKNRREVT